MYRLTHAPQPPMQNRAILPTALFRKSSRFSVLFCTVYTKAQPLTRCRLLVPGG